MKVTSKLPTIVVAIGALMIMLFVPRPAVMPSYAQTKEPDPDAELSTGNAETTVEQKNDPRIVNEPSAHASSGENIGGGVRPLQEMKIGSLLLQKFPTHWTLSIEIGGRVIKIQYPLFAIFID